MVVFTALVAALSTAAINVGLAIGLGSLAWTVGPALGYLTAAVGLSYAQSALARTLTDKSGGAAPDTPAAINTPAVRGNVKQETPDQRVPVGETRTGGAMFLYEVKPPYLYVGFLYSPITITKFVSLYCGERLLKFGFLRPNEIVSPVRLDGQPDYPARLELCVQLGTLDQGVNPLIARDLPECGDRFMTPGVANAVFRCDYGADADEFLALWGNVTVPNFQWVVQGVRVADPRVPGCRLDFDPRDPEELFAALDTWRYSDNAALIQNWWAMMPFGLNAGPKRINWVRESIDFDDESVGLKGGGFQPRHTVSAVLSLSDKPNTVLDALMTANRGFASQHAGRFEVYSSQPREPVLTITDAMLVGAFEFRRIKPKRELVNIARCEAIAPERDFQSAEFPVLRRDDYVERDGEEFEQSVRLPVTPGNQRAQRLLKGFLAEARLERFLTCNVTLEAYGLREGMIVRRHSETGRYSAQNGLYSVEEWGLAADRSSMSLSLSEFDPSIARDWDPETDEMPFVLEPSEE